LNENFIGEYKNTLDNCDIKILFYDPKAVEKKGLNNISEKAMKSAFKDDSLFIFSDSDELKKFLFELDYKESNLLFMSSGNYASLDLNEIREFIKGN
jgi:hypothetical protein